MPNYIEVENPYTKKIERVPISGTKPTQQELSAIFSFFDSENASTSPVKRPTTPTPDRQPSMQPEAPQRGAQGKETLFQKMGNVVSQSYQEKVRQATQPQMHTVQKWSDTEDGRRKALQRQLSGHVRRIQGLDLDYSAAKKRGDSKKMKEITAEKKRIAEDTELIYRKLGTIEGAIPRMPKTMRSGLNPLDRMIRTIAAVQDLPSVQEAYLANKQPLLDERTLLLAKRPLPGSKDGKRLAEIEAILKQTDATGRLTGGDEGQAETLGLGLQELYPSERAGYEKTLKEDLDNPIGNVGMVGLAAAKGMAQAGLGFIEKLAVMMRKGVGLDGGISLKEFGDMYTAIPAQPRLPEGTPIDEQVAAWIGFGLQSMGQVLPFMDASIGFAGTKVTSAGMLERIRSSPGSIKQIFDKYKSLPKEGQAVLDAIVEDKVPKPKSEPKPKSTKVTQVKAKTETSTVIEPEETTMAAKPTTKPVTKPAKVPAKPKAKEPNEEVQAKTEDSTQSANKAIETEEIQTPQKEAPVLKGKTILTDPDGNKWVENGKDGWGATILSDPKGKLADRHISPGELENYKPDVVGEPMTIGKPMTMGKPLELGKQAGEKTAEVPTAPKAGDTIEVAPEQNINGRIIVHPKQKAVIESVAQRDGDGTFVVRFKYKTQKGVEKTGYVNEIDMGAKVSTPEKPKADTVDTGSTPVASTKTSKLDDFIAHHEAEAKKAEAKIRARNKPPPGKKRETGSIDPKIRKENIDYLAHKGVAGLAKGAKGVIDAVKKAADVMGMVIHADMWKDIAYSILTKAEKFGVKIDPVLKKSLEEIATPPDNAGKYAASNAAQKDLLARSGIDKHLPATKRNRATVSEALETYDKDTHQAKLETEYQKVENGGKATALTDAENIQTAFLSADLAKDLTDISNKIEAAIKRGEDATVLQAKRTEKLKEIHRMAMANKWIGTSQSHALSSRNFAVLDDYTEAGLYKEFTIVGERLPSTKSERIAKELSVEYAENEAKIVELEKENTRLKAERNLKREARKGNYKASVSIALDRLKKKWADSAEGKMFSDPTGIGAISDFGRRMIDVAPEIMQLVRAVLNKTEGKAKIGDVALEVSEILKKEGIEIAPDDIILTVAGEYRTRMTPSDFTKRMAELRKEARSSIPGQRARLEKQIKALEKQLAAEALEARRDSTVLSRELGDRYTKREALKIQVAKHKAELKLAAELEGKNWWQKQLYYANPMTLTRSLVASTDVSFFSNQGIFFLVTHPIKSIAAFGQSLPALFSHDYFANQMAKVRTGADFDFMVESGLSVEGAFLDMRNEWFTSPLLHALGFSVSHKGKRFEFYPFAMGERAFILNETLQRIKVMQGYLDGARRLSRKPITLKEGKAFAEAVNTLSGRGTGGIAAALKQFNAQTQALFAPGYAVSRIKTALGAPLIQTATKGRSLRTLALVGADYVKYMIAVEAMLQYAKSNGFEVEENIKSSNYKKIRVNGEWVDLTSGIARLWSLGAQMFSGTVIDKHGEEMTRNPLDMFAQWASNKASPVVRAGGLALYSKAKAEKARKDGKSEEEIKKASEVWGTSYDPFTKEGWKNIGLGFLPISMQTIWVELPENKNLSQDERVILSILAMLGFSLTHQLDKDGNVMLDKDKPAPKSQPKSQPKSKSKPWSNMSSDFYKR